MEHDNFYFASMLHLPPRGVHLGVIGNMGHTQRGKLDRMLLLALRLRGSVRARAAYGYSWLAGVGWSGLVDSIDSGGARLIVLLALLVMLTLVARLGVVRSCDSRTAPAPPSRRG